jgi:hypothetical protein
MRSRQEPPNSFAFGIADIVENRHVIGQSLKSYNRLIGRHNSPAIAITDQIGKRLQVVLNHRGMMEDMLTPFGRILVGMERGD